MKRKTRANLFAAIIAILIITLTILAFVLAPNALRCLLELTCLFALIPLFILFTKKGKTQIQRNETKQSGGLINWWINILAIQLVAYGLFLGQSATLIQYEVINHHLTHTSAVHLLHDTVLNTLLNWGLFPWTVIIFFATCFALLANHYPKRAQIVTHSTMLSSMNFKLSLRTIDIFIRSGTNILFSTIIAFAAIQINQLLFGAKAVAMNSFLGGICALLIIFLCTSEKFRNIVKKLSGPKYIVGIQFLTILILMSILFALFSLIMNLILAHAGNIVKVWTTANIFKLNQIPNLFHLWFYVWWIVATPILASLLWKTSSGRSIRSMILVSIIFPALLGLFTYYHPSWLSILLLHPGVTSCIQLISVGFFILWLFSPQAKATLWLGHYPSSSIKPRTQLDMNWMLAGVSLGLFALGGIQLVPLPFVAMVIIIFLGFVWLLRCLKG